MINSSYVANIYVDYINIYAVVLVLRLRQIAHWR